VEFGSGEEPIVPDFSDIFDPIPDGIDIDPTLSAGRAGRTARGEQAVPLAARASGSPASSPPSWRWRWLAGRVAWNWGLGDLDGRAPALGQDAAAGRLGEARQQSPPRPRASGPAAWAAPSTAKSDAIQLSDAYEESRYGRPDLVRIDDADAESSYNNLRGALAREAVAAARPRKKA
jgi:hypothetical protein